VHRAQVVTGRHRRRDLSGEFARILNLVDRRRTPHRSLWGACSRRPYLTAQRYRPFRLRMGSGMECNVPGVSEWAHAWNHHPIRTRYLPRLPSDSAPSPSCASCRTPRPPYRPRRTVTSTCRAHWSTDVLGCLSTRRSQCDRRRALPETGEQRLADRGTLESLVRPTSGTSISERS
jgi:hypothetical protein